jgi:hypothetical protein
MWTQQIRRWAAVAALVAAAGTAQAVEVKLTVTDDAGVPRRAATVTSGVPFARGAVKDVARLSAAAGGKNIPAQFLPIAPWDDGSVRWALVDCQIDVPAGGRTELVVRDDGKNPARGSSVRVSEKPGSVAVSTGPLEFRIDTKAFRLFESLKVDGQERLTGAGRGLVIRTEDGKDVVAGAPTTVAVRQAGPMKAVIWLEGIFPGLHKGLIGYTAEVTAYAGRRFLKLRVWLKNDGAHGYCPRDEKWNPEWFVFDGMAVELGLGLGDPIRAECEGVSDTGRLKVLQVIQPPKDYRVQVAWALDDLRYTITGNRKSLKRGNRTDGVVALSGPDGKLTAAVRHFWEQYEKAIELDGTTLKLWLWPTEGQYPRPWVSHVCPGYARKMMLPLRHDGFYNLPGAVHKGHECILDFSGRDPKQTAAELSRPLFALASAEYYAATEAAPGLFAPPEVRTDDDECNAKLDAWMRMTRSAADPTSESSIWHARTERKTACRNWGFGFWYGWMDFGDLAVPGSGTVNLHYDWPYVMLLDLLRTGDLNCLRLATEMTRHRVDIDQQWSDRDRPEYRGFQRAPGTYAHFHCSRFSRSQPNVVSNWLAGVVLYHMLTGDLKARECIERNSRAIPRAWDRILKSKDYYVRRIPGHMQGVARAMFAYVAMHGLTGDKVWLDRSLDLFRRCVVAKWKAHGPHLHDRKQIRSQSYTRDDIRYCYSLHTFCLLHHVTGDKKLFELLRAGCEQDFPENFFDAPLFLADLHAYVALKTGNRELLDDAVEQWIMAFPESKSPPVYLPNNSQWSRRKAMFMRAGHLLQYAHWKRKGE